MNAVELLELVDSMTALAYGGEAIDQRMHSLQCAEHARVAGADGEVIVACALHDVGRCTVVRRVHHGVPHERAGELFLAEVCGPRVAWLVGAHVEAKRFLVSTDPGYAALLSPASIRSLRVQGGPMSEQECEQYSANPWHPEALLLRRWDEASKDPDGIACDRGVLLDALRGVLL